MEQVRKSESAARRNSRVARSVSALARRLPVLSPRPGPRPWVTCVLLMAGLASGATRTWTGAGANDYWTSPANWGGTSPAAGDDLVFSGSTRLTPNNDITPGTAFNSITFNAGSGPFTVGGNPIALSGGASAIANNATGGANTLNLPITFNAAPTISAAAGGLLDLGGSLNAGAFTTTLSCTGNVNISGSLTGSAGLTKIGNGVLQLNATNTYTGTTDVTAGVLIVNNPSALGTAAAGTNVASGAALDLKGVNYSASEALTLEGTGIAGGGALINSAAAPATFAGLITLGGNASIVGGAGTIAIMNLAAITGTGFNLTLGGNAGGLLKSILATGSGSLTKQDNGAWVLTGANTYTGTTTVSAGALVPLNASALGATSSGTIVAAGATLDLHGVNYANPEPLTLNGLGPGNIGALTNDSTGAAVFAGLITLGSASSIKCGAGSISLTHTGTITGAGYSLTLGGASSGDLAGIVGTGSGGLIKDDAGTWTLSGANTYTGATTISAGTLKLGAAGTIPDGSAVTADGTLEMNGFSETIGSLAGSGFVDNNAGSGIITLTAGGSNVQTTFSGIIENTTQTVALTKNGTAYMLLTGANTYAGLTTVNGGVLSIGNNGASGVLPGNCVVASGAAVRFARSDAQTYSGDISGAGQVMKINAGALTMTGSNTYTGSTLITGGAFIIGNGGNYGSVTGTLILAGGGSGSIVFNRSDNMTYSGQITGADATGSVVKNGPNTLTLSGANDYTGATVVNYGTLKLASQTALGTTAGGTSVAYGAALDLGGVDYSDAEPLTLNGTGVSGGGALMNSGANQAAFAGPITLGSGVTITGGPAYGIDLTNTGSISGNFPLTLDGTQGGFLAGSLSSGTLIKQGTGNWTFTGTSPMALASLTLSGGTLDLGSGLTHSVSSSLSLTGGTLDFGSSTLRFAGSSADFSALAAVTPGTGTLEFDGSTGVQVYTPRNSAENPNIAHTGAGTLRLNAYPLDCQSFSQTAGILDFNGLDITTVNGGNLSITNGTPSSISGLDGVAITVDGTATLAGSSSGSRLNLYPAGNWTLAATGAIMGSFLTLGNCNAAVQPGICGNCLGNAGNSNWTFYTSWDGGGGDHKWSTAANWGGDAVPSAAEDVAFDGLSSDDALLDVDGAVRSIVFTNGYTGDFSFSTHTLSVGGAIADFSSGGSITAGTGTLAFTGADTQTFIPKTGATFPNIRQNGSAGAATVIGAALTAGDLILASGKLDLGTGFIHSFANVSGAGTLDFNGSELDANGNVDLSGLAVTASSGNVLAFTGSGSQTFAPNPSVTALKLSKTGSGITTVAGSGFGTPLLTLAAGTLQLGGALNHTAADLAFTGGSLNMGSSRLSTSAANVDFHLLTAVAFPTDSSSLEFTGGTAQTFLTKTGINFPKVIQNGAGGTTVITNDPIAKRLSLVSGILHLGSSRTFTVSDSLLPLGGGLDFGTSASLVFGGASFDMQPISPMTAGTGILELNGTNPQTYTPKASAMHPILKASGAGGTTILANGLQTSSILVSNGILHLGSGLVHATAAFTGASGGLDFGSSTLAYSGTGINLALLGTVIRGTGTLRFTGASASLQPHATDTLPAIQQAGVGTTTVIANGLKTGSLAPLSGTFHFGSGLNHSIGSISMGGGPYGSLNFGSSQVHIAGNADLGSLTALTSGSGTLYFEAATGTQIFTPKAGGSAHPPVYHTGAGTLRLAANNLTCAAFTQSAGVLDLNGSNLATIGAFTVANGTPASLANLGGRTLTVGGNASLTGTSGATRLAMAPASAWTLAVTGALTASFADLAFNTASSAPGTCLSCVNAGSNVNWTFPDSAQVLGGIAIADAAGRTRDADPALGFTWSGADSMRVSLLADTATAAWIGLRAVDSLNLAAGADGMRILAAQFKKISGSRSIWYRDTTFLDRTGPVASLDLKSVHSWRNWPNAVSGRAVDAIAGTDSVWVIRSREADGAYFNGAGWSSVADTARFRADSVFSVPLPSSAMAEGYYNFTLSASDKLGNRSGPLAIRVNYQENRAPAAAAISVADTALQNQQVSWNVDIGDYDAGDSVITVTASVPAWLTLTETPDTARGGFAAHRIYGLAGKPSQADVGNASVTLQARDLGGKTFTYSKTFAVIDVNDPPVFASGQDSTGAKEDSLSRFVPRYADADPRDPHSLALLQAPAWVRIADSALEFRPGSRDIGPALVRVTVSDGRLLDTLDLKVNVANVNDRPYAFPSAGWQAKAHWKEDVADSFSVVVVDMDKGDNITLATVLPAWITWQGSVDPVEGFNRFFRFAVKPGQADTGEYDFKLRFQDAVGAFSELPLAAKVAAVNDVPTALIVGQESRAGAARIALDVSDQDGNAASTRFHYRLIGSSGDTLRRGICPAALLPLHPLADGDYRLAVAAEDEGGLRQPGYTTVDLRISGATTLFLDTARWHMIGYPGRSLSAGALGAGAALATWDESAGDGSPLGRYASGKPADSLARGKGYWVRVAGPVTVAAPFPELLDRPYTMKLTHGRQGWNQVGNPFPYFVDLSKSGLTFWEWDAARRDLVNSKGILKPWNAYWVQVAKDTVLTIKDQPWFPAGAGAGGVSGPLAKSADVESPIAPVSDRGSAAAAAWTLQMALRAGPYQDQANFLGIRDVTMGASAGDESAGGQAGPIADAPKFGDYIALHFGKPGDKAGDAPAEKRTWKTDDAASAEMAKDIGYAEDFRPRMGEGEEWWDFTVENSGSGYADAELSLPGLRNLEALGLHAFLVRRGEAVPVSADAPAVLPMEGSATYYSLVVTPDAGFAARLKGDFSLSQNFPNPVEAFTSFRFVLPQTWDAAGKRDAKGYRLRLNVYDYSGRLAARVADAAFKPGSHTLLWKPRALNGGVLAKGAYVYRLEAPGFAKSLKMLVK